MTHSVRDNYNALQNRLDQIIRNKDAVDSNVGNLTQENRKNIALLNDMKPEIHKLTREEESLRR